MIATTPSLLIRWGVLGIDQMRKKLWFLTVLLTIFSSTVFAACSNSDASEQKTILCRASECDRYKSLADIDKPEVRVMVNPGGLNEKFAHENLTHATILVHQKNEEIPTLIAEGAADVMITEITEAPYYVQTDTRLAAPLLNEPFTDGEIGVLMRKGQEDLLQLVNSTIQKMKADGSLRRLHEKYGLVYAYPMP